MMIYILVTSLSLPGAAIMTLAGGALFGLLIGTIVVSFASTIGATLACFVSRFVLRDWVQGKIVHLLFPDPGFPKYYQNFGFKNIRTKDMRGRTVAAAPHKYHL